MSCDSSRHDFIQALLAHHPGAGLAPEQVEAVYQRHRAEHPNLTREKLLEALEMGLKLPGLMSPATTTGETEERAPVSALAPPAQIAEGLAQGDAGADYRRVFNASPLHASATEMFDDFILPATEGVDLAGQPELQNLLQTARAAYAAYETADAAGEGPERDAAHDAAVQAARAFAGAVLPLEAPPTYQPVKGHLSPEDVNDITNLIIHITHDSDFALGAKDWPHAEMEAHGIRKCGACGRFVSIATGEGHRTEPPCSAGQRWVRESEVIDRFLQSEDEDGPLLQDEEGEALDYSYTWDGQTLRVRVNDGDDREFEAADIHGLEALEADEDDAPAPTDDDLRPVMSNTEEATLRVLDNALAQAAQPQELLRAARHLWLALPPEAEAVWESNSAESAPEAISEAMHALALAETAAARQAAVQQVREALANIEWEDAAQERQIGDALQQLETALTPRTPPAGGVLARAEAAVREAAIAVQNIENHAGLRSATDVGWPVKKVRWLAKFLNLPLKPKDRTAEAVRAAFDNAVAAQRAAHAEAVAQLAAARGEPVQGATSLARAKAYVVAVQAADERGDLTQWEATMRSAQTEAVAAIAADTALWQSFTKGRDAGLWQAAHAQAGRTPASRAAALQAYINEFETQTGELWDPAAFLTD
jgi:hypothetical protein